jgi:predicted nuclease of predicted toxin-antitoxin system
VKFLFDENLSHVHAVTFRANGLDAVAIVEAGLSGASDGILITLDGDFANVLRFPPDSTPGVVRLRLRQPTENAITLALKKCCVLAPCIISRGS